MGSKVGSYGQSSLGKSGKCLTPYPSQVPASSPKGKGTGSYSHSNLGTPMDYKTSSGPQSSGGKGVGPYAK